MVIFSHRKYGRGRKEGVLLRSNHNKLCMCRYTHTPMHRKAKLKMYRTTCAMAHVCEKSARDGGIIL